MSTFNTLNNIRLMPEGKFDFSTNPNLYRVCMYGNIEEIVVGTMSLENTNRIIGLPQAAVNEIVFGKGGTKSFVRFGSQQDPMYQLPQFLEVSEEFRFSGLVVDDDLRINVEDSNGNVLYELTSFLIRNIKPQYANDNTEFYEIGDYNGLNPNLPVEGHEASAGVFNARSFERGAFYYTFETDEGLMPWEVTVPFQDMTTHLLTTQALYNGYPALEFDAYRWTIKPPQASVEYLKAA